MSVEVAALLRKAREKIAVPERWTRGAFARNAKGESLPDGFDKRAVRYSGFGAIEAASGREITEYLHLVDTLSAVVGRRFEDFNDDPATTHADVLAAFDRAIAFEESN